MSMRSDRSSGSTLVASGTDYAVLTASTSVKAGPSRICRILVVSGTGSIDIYDGIDNTGKHLYSVTATAGGNYVIDCPVLTGIYIVLGANTTITVVYA